jgi:hypothetical protein
MSKPDSRSDSFESSHDPACSTEGCVACANGIEDFELNLEETIEKYGHAVVSTQIDIAEGDLNVSFTVGLSRSGLPELIMFALPSDMAQVMLNTSADLLRSGSLPKDVGVAQVAEGLNVVFKKALIEKVRLVTYALEAFSGIESPYVLQLVWPDKAGMFPWQHGFDGKLRSYQPSLYEAE